MTLTDEQIAANREHFISLMNTITRPNCDLEGLGKHLINSNFFTAPASTIYHLACKGGLCQHQLNVESIAQKLNEMFGKPYSEETIRIVSLWHDFDKEDKYEQYFRNEKVYSPTGSKYDEMGKFDWRSVPAWKRRDDKDVFSIGTHGENSAYMLETFIPLSVEEHCAIINHHSVYDNNKLNVTGIYSKYHLACLLHCADMMATYICESE